MVFRIRAVAAAVIAAVTSCKQIFGGHHEQAVLKIIIDTFDKFRFWILFIFFVHTKTKIRGCPLIRVSVMGSYLDTPNFEFRQMR